MSWSMYPWASTPRKRRRTSSRSRAEQRGAPTRAPPPPPPPTPTPAAVSTPTPSPALTGSVFLPLSDQTALDYSLSPDSSRLVFLVPSLVEGEFVFLTHIAAIKTEQVSPLSVEGLPAGQHLHPLWPTPGPGRLVFIAKGGQRLPAPKGAEVQPAGWLKAE